MDAGGQTDIQQLSTFTLPVIAGLAVLEILQQKIDFLMVNAGKDRLSLARSLQNTVSA